MTNPTHTARMASLAYKDSQTNKSNITNLDATKLESFNGRTSKAVVPTAGDYGSNLITNQSGVAGSTVSDALGTLNGQVWVPGAMTRYNGLAQNLNGTNVVVDWSGSDLTLGSHVTFDPAFPTRIGV